MVKDLDAPQASFDETAGISDLCGLPMEADVSGHVMAVAVPGGRRMVDHNVSGARVVYRNPANGRTIRRVDVGPHRADVRDGRLLAAVPGRFPTGSGVIGLVAIDLTTFETVFRAGYEVGIIDDGFCEAPPSPGGARRHRGKARGVFPRAVFHAGVGSTRRSSTRLVAHAAGVPPGPWPTRRVSHPAVRRTGHRSNQPLE